MNSMMMLCRKCSPDSSAGSSGTGGPAPSQPSSGVSPETCGQTPAPAAASTARPHIVKCYGCDGKGPGSGPLCESCENAILAAKEASTAEPPVGTCWIDPSSRRWYRTRAARGYLYMPTDKDKHPETCCYRGDWRRLDNLFTRVTEAEARRHCGMEAVEPPAPAASEAVGPSTHERLHADVLDLLQKAMDEGDYDPADDCVTDPFCRRVVTVCGEVLGYFDSMMFALQDVADKAERWLEFGDQIHTNSDGKTSDWRWSPAQRELFDAIERLKAARESAIRRAGPPPGWKEKPKVDDPLCDKEQAEAWNSVCRELDKADPDWHTRTPRGMDSAVTSIRSLAAIVKAAEVARDAPWDGNFNDLWVAIDAHRAAGRGT